MNRLTMIEKFTKAEYNVIADFFEIKDGKVFLKKRSSDDGNNVVAVFNMDALTGFILGSAPEGGKENDA